MALLSVALIAVATVLLVVGLLGDGGLTPILLSIGCSAGAAVVLGARERRRRVSAA